MIEEGDLRMSCRLELKIIKDSTQTLELIGNEQLSEANFCKL